jgi:hypothetical protein
MADGKRSKTQRTTNGRLPKKKQTALCFVDVIGYVDIRSVTGGAFRLLKTHAPTALSCLRQFTRAAFSQRFAWSPPVRCLVYKARAGPVFIQPRYAACR